MVLIDTVKITFYKNNELKEKIFINDDLTNEVKELLYKLIK